MKKIYHTIILLAMIATILSAFKCNPNYEDENYHLKILFENSWKKPIYMDCSFDYRWERNPFENYFHFSEKPMNEYPNSNKILPGETNSEITKKFEYYEAQIQNGDSVAIIVFDGQQPDKKDSDCFLVYYLLSIKDLQKVNFHLTYPPNENMKNFHMKPSYEEVIRQSQTR